MTIRTIRAIAISLLAVLAPASGETTDPHAACPRLPFQLSHHKVVLEVRVGDAKSLTVLLDTGMSGDGLFLYKPETPEQFTLDGWTEHRVRGRGSWRRLKLNMLKTKIVCSEMKTGVVTVMWALIFSATHSGRACQKAAKENFSSTSARP